MTFTNAWPRWTAPLIVGCFALGAVPAGLEFGTAAAIATASTGVIVVAAIAYFRTHTTIVCDDDGATVTCVSRRKGTSTQRFAWADVDRVEHSSVTTATSDVPRTIRIFTVIVKGQKALEVTSEWRDFDAVRSHFMLQADRQRSMRLAAS